MKILQAFPLFLLIFGLTFTACSDDDGEVTNEITVDIQSPTEGKEVSLSDGDHLHSIVIINTNLALHQVEYMIYPTGDRDNPVVVLNGHGNGNGEEEFQVPSAPNEIKFTENTGLVPGSYVLEVKACGEHMCEGETVVTETRNFTIVD